MQNKQKNEEKFITYDHNAITILSIRGKVYHTIVEWSLNGIGITLINQPLCENILRAARRRVE